MKDKAKLIHLNEAKWDQWADSLDGDGRKYVFLREAQSRVISLLDIHPNVHFLDVGCGTGWAVGQAAELASDQGSFYGVDLSPRMIEKAKSNFSDKPSLHFLQASADSIPLEADFFDILICTNSFHHYPDPFKALKEMARLLKAGGKIYILDPTSDHWIIRAADQFIRRVEPEHVKIYSSKEFQQMFLAAGLKPAGVKAINWHQGIHLAEK